MPNGNGPGARQLGTEAPQLAYSLDQFNKISSGLRVSPISENYRRDNLKRESEHKQLMRDRQLSERNKDAGGNLTFALPKSEFTARRNELGNTSRRQPEAPCFAPPNSTRTNPRGNENGKGLGNQVQEGIRRMESIPRNLDNNRDGLRDGKPFPSSGGLPQAGRDLVPNLPRPFDGCFVRTHPETTRVIG